MSADLKKVWTKSDEELPDGSNSDTRVPWAFKAKRPQKHALRIDILAKDSTERIFPAVFIEGYGFVSRPAYTLYRREVIAWSYAE